MHTIYIYIYISLCVYFTNKYMARCLVVLLPPRRDGHGPYMHMGMNKMIQVCVYLYVYNSVMYTCSIYKCK